MIYLTEELYNVLLQTEKEGMDEFSERYGQIFEECSLPEYLEYLLEKYDMKKSEVINRSQFNVPFGYDIFSGAKRASRDKLLKLSFGFPLNLKEVERLLYYGGVSALYPKVKRDAFLIFAIGRQYGLDQVNELLFENGLKPFET